jgi:hypothetical protein
VRELFLIKHKLVMALSMVLIAGLLIAGAPAASATASNANASNDAVGTLSAGSYPCVWNVGLTIKDGSTIRGSGSMACGPNDTVYLRIQAKLHVYMLRLKYLGTWVKVAENSRGATTVPVNWRLSVAKYCGGSGTYTYKTISNGTVFYFGSEPISRNVTSNQLRATC